MTDEAIEAIIETWVDEAIERRHQDTLDALHTQHAEDCRCTFCEIQYEQAYADWVDEQQLKGDTK